MSCRSGAVPSCSAVWRRVLEGAARLRLPWQVFPTLCWGAGWGEKAGSKYVASSQRLFAFICMLEESCALPPAPVYLLGARVGDRAKGLVVMHLSALGRRPRRRYWTRDSTAPGKERG